MKRLCFVCICVLAVLLYVFRKDRSFDMNKYMLIDDEIVSIVGGAGGGCIYIAPCDTLIPPSLPACFKTAEDRSTKISMREDVYDDDTPPLVTACRWYTYLNENCWGTPTGSHTEKREDCP